MSVVRNSQDSWQRPPHEAPPWGGATSAFATLHPPWPGARVPSYSCPAASWTEQGFVSSDCWWDRRRELSQVLTEAFLPPRLHRVTSCSPTMGQAYRQPATRGIVATNFAAHAFFIVSFFPRVILNQWLSALGRDRKVPSEGPRPPFLPDRCFGGRDSTRRGRLSRLNSHSSFPR